MKYVKKINIDSQTFNSIHSVLLLGQSTLFYNQYSIKSPHEIRRGP
jgi:hypothetical protein